MTNSFPQRGQVSFIPQTDLISLHKTHIYKGRKHVLRIFTKQPPPKSKPTQYYLISQARSEEFSEHWCYSPGTKQPKQNIQLKCHYPNQSLAKWNRQFFSCSSPGPIWLWCYLGSNSKDKTFIRFLKSCLLTHTILTVLYSKTVEKLKLAVPVSQQRQILVFIPMAWDHTICRR